MGEHWTWSEVQFEEELIFKMEIIVPTPLLPKDYLSDMEALQTGRPAHKTWIRIIRKTSQPPFGGRGIQTHAVVHHHHHEDGDDDDGEDNADD